MAMFSQLHPESILVQARCRYTIPVYQHCKHDPALTALTALMILRRFVGEKGVQL